MNTDFLGRHGRHCSLWITTAREHAQEYVMIQLLGSVSVLDVIKSLKYKQVSELYASPLKCNVLGELSPHLDELLYDDISAHGRLSL